MADTDKTREEFIEKIGQIAQGEGLPKSASQVFGLLMFDGEPVSFSNLAEELKVGRGSVGSNVRLLEDRGVIKRIGVPVERQDFFQMADQPFADLLAGALKRIERAEQEIEASLSDLPEEAEAPRKRPKSFSAFYRTLGGGLQHDLSATKDKKR